MRGSVIKSLDSFLFGYWPFSSPVTPSVPISRQVDKWPGCSLLWFQGRIQTMQAPVHAKEPSLQPLYLTIIKSKANHSSLLSQAIFWTFLRTHTSLSKSHYVNTKSLSYPLGAYVVSSVSLCERWWGGGPFHSFVWQQQGQIVSNI